MIEINLLPEEIRGKAKKLGSSAIDPRYFLYLAPLAAGVLLFMHVYLGALAFVKGWQLSSLEHKWQNVSSERKTLEEFTREHTGIAEDAGAIQKFNSQRLNWSEKLNKLSLSLPSGVWFTELSFSGDNFLLQGSVLSFQKEEMSLLNRFIDALKKDQGFFADFKSLELSSVQKKEIGGYEIADFLLTGALKSK